MEMAKLLISKLDFEGCIEAYDKLPAGHPFIDLVFDRMEELDADRFYKWFEE